MTDETCLFRLYVAGETPQSLRTVEAVRRMCQALAPGHYELQVINLLHDPAAATRDCVTATPTLVRARPLPTVQIMGDLLNTESVCRMLASVDQAPYETRLRVATCSALPRD